MTVPLKGDSEAIVRSALLRRVRQVVLFVDMVESVRLIDADETNVVRLWLDLAGRIEREILPAGGGKLVKRMGDGLLLAFADAPAAVTAALRLQALMAEINAGRGAGSEIRLRMALDAGDTILTEDSDLMGRTVNHAARLQTHAAPGDILATAEVHDAMADELDAQFEDIGDVWIRHLDAPIRAFRVLPPGARARIRPLAEMRDPRPTIAVIPPAPRDPSADDLAVGEVIAEDLIFALSRIDAVNVTSRLSTTAFRMRQATSAEIGGALGADYVVAGVYSARGGRIRAELRLEEARSGAVAWSRRLDIDAVELLAQGGVLEEMASEMYRALALGAIRKALSRPPATLEDYALLMSGVALMHRLSPRDFTLARTLMETLVERAPRQPLPLAWLARWHVLSVVQGWTSTPERAAGEALQCTRRALDIDPHNVPALVAEGFVLNNLMRRLDEAETRYDLALETNPNDAAGRLLRGVLYAFRGEGPEAMRDTERALHLAPLDPHRHFYESLAASACIAAENYGRALDLAKSSLRANRAHTTTLRVKAVAEQRLGRIEEAHRTAEELLRIQPGLTVSGWLRTAPSADFEVGRKFADSLREAGVPD